MRTAVLIHGFHLDSTLTVDGRTYDWHDMVIGRIGPVTATGRATFGTLLAYAEKARLIIFSTGASSKDGLSEAAYTYQAVLEHADRLAGVLGAEVETFRHWLNFHATLDEMSQTTQEELDRNLRRCADDGIEKVILVTNRFHAPRALANANDARRKLKLDMTIMASSPEDPSTAPTIFEPPTRPDRSPVDFRPALAKIFGIPAERRSAALADIEAAIAKHLG